MSDYNEHLISQAGGDGDVLAEIEARRGDDTCPVHTRCLRSDVQNLLALVREQATKLEAQEEQLTAILDLATVSARHGWMISAKDIRDTLAAR